MKFKKNIAKILTVLLIANTANVVTAMDKPNSHQMQSPSYEYEPCTREYKKRCIIHESTDMSDDDAEPTESPQEQKKRVLENYQPNFAEMQKIGLGIMKKNSQGEEEEILIVPDVHFKDTDGKEYFVFYNNHLGQLRELLIKKFEMFHSEHNIALFPSSPLLYNFIESGELRYTKLARSCVRSVTLNFISFNPWTFSTIQRAFSLSNTCGDLKRVITKNGANFEADSTPIALILNRDIASDNNSTEPFCEIRNIPEYLSAVEKNLYHIAMTTETDIAQISAMESELDRIYRQARPWVSDHQMINFCFALNRASDYLSRLERDIQSKPLETVKAMDKFRRKINRLLLEYRFIFEQNSCPFFGIKVDRYKILENTKMAKTIFLDRNETKKFQQEIECELDRRAQSLRKKYDFVRFSSEELRNLACELKIDSYQSLIDSLEDKIAEMEKEHNDETLQAITNGLKIGLKIVGNVIKMSKISENGKLVERNFDLKKVQEYLAIEDKRKAMAAEQAKMDASSIDCQDFMSEDFAEQTETTIIADASTPFIPQNVDFYRSFDNPQNIVCSEAKETFSDESMADSESTIDPTSSFRYKHTPQMPTASIIYQNNTDIGTWVQKMHLSPEDVDMISDSLQHVINSSYISKKIEMLKNQKANLEKLMDREIDYINLFKLYIQIVRRNFDQKIDFGGSLITERRDVDKKNYQYIVREIQTQEELL